MLNADTLKPEGLLQAYNLRGEDAERLVLELLEALGHEEAPQKKPLLMEHLREVMRRGVKATRDAEATVSFETAAWESVDARAGRRAATQRDLRYFVRRMLREKGTGKRPLRAMTTGECRVLLSRCFAHSPQGFRKARAILHSIFEYGRQHDWCGENPVNTIATPSVHEREIHPLSMDEVRLLEATTLLPEHAAMHLPLQLMLRCGLRPYEVQRLRDDDIDWQENIVRIRPVVSKTGGGRIVPLRLPQHTLPTPLPRGLTRRWKALRRAAGFTHWQADTLRHTFASYHAAYFRDLPGLQLEMGHRDCALLRSRYVNMHGLTPKDAALFWAGCLLRKRVPSAGSMGRMA